MRDLRPAPRPLARLKPAARILSLGFHMTRRKRQSRTGQKHSAKPDDLRTRGPVFPVVVTRISDTPAQLRSNVGGH